LGFFHFSAKNHECGLIVVKVRFFVVFREKVTTVLLQSLQPLFLPFFPCFLRQFGQNGKTSAAIYTWFIPFFRPTARCSLAICQSLWAFIRLSRMLPRHAFPQWFGMLCSTVTLAAINPVVPLRNRTSSWTSEILRPHLPRTAFFADGANCTPPPKRNRQAADVLGVK